MWGARSVFVCRGGSFFWVGGKLIRIGWRELYGI